MVLDGLSLSTVSVDIYKDTLTESNFQGALRPSRYQQGIRDRAAPRIEGGEIIRVEAHPIPEHPRPWRVKERSLWVGRPRQFSPQKSNLVLRAGCCRCRYCYRYVMKFQEVIKVI